MRIGLTPEFKRAAPLAWCWLLLGLPCLVQAQAARDPTLPPAAVASLATGNTGASLGSVVLESGNMALMVREGVYYLMVGTRLYAKGQRIGQARIERITETEVWLREKGVVRKLAVFAGIERRLAVPVPDPKKAAGVLRSNVVKP